MIEQLKNQWKSVWEALWESLPGSRPKILLFVNLPQDLDMLLPLAERLQKMEDSRLAVMVSDKAWKQSPRIGKLLKAASIEPRLLNHKAVVAGLQPSLRNTKAVVTASESTANAHKGPHTLTQRANQKGIPTYTMQHGFDNVGVTYFDEEYPVGRIMFASQTFFTWGKVSDLPAETPAETRAKCVAVGCPKFIDSPFAKVGKAQQIPGRAPGSTLIVVFENLHWSRYSDDYRQRFLQDLEQSAITHPKITFLVKPHHTGLWLTQRYQGKVPVADNLIVADPKAPEWEVFTAPALIEIADAVLTTPSTVAVDAARSHCPVAVVAYDLELPNYEPLPLLHSREDWQTFVEQAGKVNNPALAGVEGFLRDRLVPGDAVGRMVDRITAPADRHLSQSAAI